MKEFLGAILRQDFASFVHKVFNEVSPGNDFANNWHIDLICDWLTDMISGTKRRVIINIPPRHLKSIICSVALPAFILGHNPKARLVCVSYSDELATKLANDCRNVMQSGWYKQIFPFTRLSASRNAQSDFETTQRGGRFSTSIGGVLTGRGGDWIIIDDPLKPSDAASDVMRGRVNDWYGSTLYSRLDNQKEGRILLIMQRLHQNDLTGFLLESNNGFELLRLPAVAEGAESWTLKNGCTIYRQPGDLLHPSREGADEISAIRASIGELVFAGQYQQRPAPATGAIICRDWLHFYNDIPQKFSHIIQSWDTASKTGTDNAFSACVTLGIMGKNIYVLDCFRKRMKFPELVRTATAHIEQAKSRYPASKYEILIEDASSGTGLIQTLQTAGFGHMVKEIRPEHDKVSRLQGITAYIETGQLLFPSVTGNWWRDFEAELLTFPNTTFKDQCDALAQGTVYAADITSRPTPSFVVL